MLTSEDLDKARAAQQDRYYQAEKSSKYRGLTTVYSEELGSKRLIQLFDAANFSTFIHESGHLFLEDLRMLATMDGAPKQVVEDWNTIKEWNVIPTKRWQSQTAQRQYSEITILLYYYTRYAKRSQGL